MTTTSGGLPPYFAQFGEDRILDEIFGHRRLGTCVEVGACDGITDSMTFHFELMGWTCLLVEPVPELFRKIIESRRCVATNCAAGSREGDVTMSLARGVPSMSTLEMTEEQRKAILRSGGRPEEIRVRTRTLDSILEEAGISEIDFLSIDVEGHEMEVLKGFSIDRYRPRIVLIEDNSHGTDSSVCDFMRSRKYRIFRRTGVNDWYAMESDQELVPPGQAERLMKTRNRAAKVNRLAQRFACLAPYVPTRAKPLLRRILGLNA